MPSPGLLLIRVAPEIATKSRRTRRRFQERLAANLRDCLASAGIPAHIEDRWSRIMVETPDPETAAQHLRAVFGVSSLSVVEARCAPVLEEIVRTGEALYAERVRDRMFAVRARRDGRYGFGTTEIMVQLGAALDRYGDVDLDHPDVTVTVELRGQEALFYSTRVPGPGGLPLGVEGRAVCLISGGFDSAVAAWLMLKRGVALEYVFCNLGGEAYERSVVSVAKVLAERWSFGYRPAIRVLEFGPVVDELRRTVEPRFWQVVLKRLFYRAAESVATALGAEAIVTGESLGQVSSQTLHNLRAIETSVSLPLLRPLVGLDKNEIIERAGQVGTAALSAHIREYCALGRDRPVTRCTPEAAEEQDACMDPAPLQEALAGLRVLDLRALQPSDLVRPYLFTHELGGDTVVLDCREPHYFQNWHYPGAVRRDLSELATHFRKLEKSARYVLYCSFGVQSALVAELMQRDGYEAYAFEGGVRELRRLVEHSGETTAAGWIGGQIVKD